MCHFFSRFFIPISSMYGIFTYIWLIFMVNVDIYIYICTIHGWYGIDNRWLALGFLNHQEYEIEKLDLEFVGNLLIGSMRLVLYSFRSMNG